MPHNKKNSDNKNQSIDGDLVADLYDTHVASTYDIDAFGLLGGGRNVATNQIHSKLVASGEFPKQGRIVDLALGTGTSLAEISVSLPDAELFGIDISANMLKIAHQKFPNIKTIHDDATNIESHFEKQSIDLALMHFLTTYIDTEKVVRSVIETMKPGAYLSIASTTYESFRFIHSFASTVLPPELIQQLNPAPVDGDSIAQLLETAGLEVIENARFEKEISFASLPELFQWGMQSGFFTHILSKLSSENFESFSSMSSHFPISDRYCSSILLARKPI